MSDNKIKDKRFFDLSSGGIVILLTAPRGSGKSVLVAGDRTIGLTGLLTDKRFFQYEFDYIFLIHQAYDKDIAYHQLKLDEDHVLEECSFENLDAIYSWCKERWNEDHEVRTMIILEDCLAKLQSLKNKKNDNTLDEIVANSRGYNCSLLISTQMYKSVSPAFRAGVDYLICFDPRTNQEKENLIEDFCFSRFSKKEFREIWDYCFKVRYDKMILDLRAGFKIVYKNFNKLSI